MYKGVMHPSADQLTLDFEPSFEDLCNARELAKLFGVSTETIANWSREGKIVRVRLSPRIVRYSRASAQEFLRTAYASAADA